MNLDHYNYCKSFTDITHTSDKKSRAKAKKKKTIHKQDSHSFLGGNDHDSHKIASSKYDMTIRRVKSNSHKRIINYTFDKVKRIEHPITLDDRYLSMNFRFHTEALPFLFHIEGCAKNILLYLITYKVDISTNCYQWNRHTMDEFKEYAIKQHNTAYKEETIKQTHNKLKYFNITL